MAKKRSLLDNPEIQTKQYDNTLINDNYKLQNLPQTSLRIKGNTHSKLLALKKLKLEESYNDILDDILDQYIQTLNSKDKSTLTTLIDQENNFKIKKQNVRK